MPKVAMTYSVTWLFKLYSYNPDNSNDRFSVTESLEGIWQLELASNVDRMLIIYQPSWDLTAGASTIMRKVESNDWCKTG